MFASIKTTLKSREFQTQAAQVGAAVVSVVISSVVSGLVNKALNTGIEKMMDKIHGPQINTPVES
jgi:hypothetical protein